MLNDIQVWAITHSFAWCVVYYYNHMIMANAFALVEARVCTILWRLQSPFHRLSLESWFGNAVQIDSNMSNMRENQECLPNVPS